MTDLTHQHRDALDRAARVTDALDDLPGGAPLFTLHGPRGEPTDTIEAPRLAEEARALGARLLARGLAPGDRVLLGAETDADFLRALFGCLYAGLVPCPTPTPGPFAARAPYVEQIARMAAVAAPRAALTPPAALDWTAEALAGRDLGYVGPVSGLDNAAESRLPGPAAADAVAYLQFSSGATSAPKGVAISHRALMANLRAIARHGLATGPEDVGVGWLPLHHDMGLVGFVFTPAATGTPAWLLAPRDFVRRPTLWPELMSRARATMTFAPSFAYALAARRADRAGALDLSRLTLAGVGGDMVRAASLDAFAAAYAGAGFRAEAFAPSYGMAEATVALAFTPKGRGARWERLDLDALEAGEARPAAADTARARRFARCGPALPGHRIEVRDAAGAALPPGRVGTIFARGPSLMSGYAAGDAIEGGIGTDGWLDTGDLGFLTADGEVTPTGRAKDLIILNGRNLWPQDLEWALERALPGCREGGVAAVGLGPAETEGDGGGEAVAVVIERRNPDPAAEAALRDAAAATLRALFGVAAQVALSRTSLPRTSSGKLARARVRALLLAGAYET